MAYRIETRQAESQIVLARRISTTVGEIGKVLGATFDTEYQTLQAQGIEPAGPPCILYHSMHDDLWELQICAPAARSGVAPDGYTFETLPGATVATTLHRGPYETVELAYRALQRWTEEHGWVPAGPVREIYLSEPDVPPEAIETVIEWPVEAAPIDEAIPSPA